MEKLIEIKQISSVKCDNENCDYVILNDGDGPNVDIKQYINVSCPKCGENLLTDRDYLNYSKVLKMIGWLNKWFSWLTFFRNKKKTVVSIETHKNITIKIGKK